MCRLHCASLLAMSILLWLVRAVKQFIAWPPFLFCYRSGVLSTGAPFFAHFLRLLTWEKDRFSNRKRPGDTFLVRGVPVGCIRFLLALDRFCVLRNRRAAVLVIFCGFFR